MDSGRGLSAGNLNNKFDGSVSCSLMGLSSTKKESPIKKTLL